MVTFMAEGKGRKKSKRVRRRIIRRLIPIMVALVLIAVVIVFSAATGLLQKYSHSTEKADLNEYFGLEEENEAAVLLDNAYSDEKAIIENDRYYISYSMVKDKLNDNFYFDSNEKLLLYTTPTETIRADSGSNEFIERNDTVYLALDYVKKYTNLEYNAYDTPNHLEIKYKWGTVNRADVTKNTQVRLAPDTKSPVLTEAASGDVVEVLDSQDAWTQVKSADGYLGYMENKMLDNYREEQENPVMNVADMVFPSQTRDSKICLGWHQVTNEAANGTLTDVMAQTLGVNVISPTWFSLSDNEGHISSIASASYVQQAHEMGLEVWGLADNFNPETDTYEVLSYTSKRAVLIQELIGKAGELQLDGINVDFENLSTETGDHFAQFIRELSIPCRERGIVLSVDNYVPKEYTEHYNRATQGKFADYVIIMGYDEHYAGSKESGSVASVDFVRDGIEQTLKDVPAEKVINAIPFYTRIWKETAKTQAELEQDSTYTMNVTSEAVGMAAAEKLIADHGVTAQWDDMAAQNYAEFQLDNALVKIWLEDEASIDVKMQLIKNNNLAGVACWKLGFEKSSVWEVIQKYL